MNLAICINTYYGADIYRFRRLLASLFVEPDYEPYLKYIEKYVDLIKQLGEEDNFKTITNIINSWFKEGINGNCMRYGENVMIKLEDKNLLIPMNDKLITFMMLITDYRSVYSTINLDRSFNPKHIYSYSDNLEFNLILSIQSIIVKKYIDINNQFETIQEYIQDLLQHNFKLTNMDQLVNENITFTFMIDSYSGIKYESFERFYAMLPENIFNQLKTEYNWKFEYDKFKLYEETIEPVKKYFTNVYQNKYDEDAIKRLHNTIIEFSTFIPFRIFISGTKYKTTVQINRNIFMAHHIDKFIQFLDDDDFSGGLFTRYEYGVRSANKVIENYEKNKHEIMKIIKKGDKNVNIRELIKLNYFEFRCFIYHYFSDNIKMIKQGKIDYKKLIKLKEKHKTKLEYLQTLFEKLSHYDMINCLTINIKTRAILHMSGFWEYIIMPYTLNNFSKIEHMVGEDCIYMKMRTKSEHIFQEVNVRPCYYYLEPSVSNEPITNQTINSLFTGIYNSMLLSDVDMIKKNIYGKNMVGHFYNYDSVVEMCDGSLEFVSHRHDREIKIEDIKDGYKWNIDRYNENIDNLY